MNKRILYHFLLIFTIGLLFTIIVNKIENLNPILKSIADIRFSDLYFSINDRDESSEIFIVDIGQKDPLQTRKEIANFIKKVNDTHRPKVIGVDVYFDAKYKDAAINNLLTEQLSSDNVIRVFQVQKTEKGDYYPDHSYLPGLETNNSSQEGYSFGLGKPTEYPCVRYFKPTFQIKKQKSNHSINLISKLIAEKYLAYDNEKLSAEINLEKKMMINYNINFEKNRIDINDSTRYHELENKIILIGINTYNSKGYPLYTDDTHFTPLNKNYIGRSIPDSYGVEILATIVSNLINNEYLSFNPILVKVLNWIISILTYIILLYLFISLNESFIFFKVLSQTIGLLLLITISLGVINFTNHYIDLSMAIAIMFIAAEIVEINEKLLIKIKPELLIKNFSNYFKTK